MGLVLESFRTFSNHIGLKEPACTLLRVYLCMAWAWRGLKRVPVRGWRRKCPGTAAWRFFLATQSPLTSRPVPPSPTRSPRMTSEIECWGTPRHTATTPPAASSRLPRQSSAPRWNAISEASEICGPPEQQQEGGGGSDHSIQQGMCLREGGVGAETGVGVC